MSAVPVRICETTDLAAVRRPGIAGGLEDSGLMDDVAAWGAYAGAQLVGALAAQFAEGLATANWLAVAESHRHGGVAGRLHAAPEREARRRGLRRLWVKARAPGFFVAQGFRRVAASPEHDALLVECPKCRQYGRGCAPQTLYKDLAGGGPDSKSSEGRAA